MFSRRERDFLSLLLQAEEGRSSRPGATLASSFPNPTYQRKMLWGIRRKAAEAIPDLELYLKVAQVQPKVLPAELPRGGGHVPLAEDPLVTLLHSVQGLGSRLVHRTSKDPSQIPPGPRRE